MRSVRTPISRAASRLLPVETICRPKTVRARTSVRINTTISVQMIGVKPVSPSHEKSESSGPKRFWPKTRLNGCCTGIRMGWLFAYETVKPVNKKNVPSVVINDGIRSLVVMNPLKNPTPIPMRIAMGAVTQSDTPPVFAHPNHQVRGQRVDRADRQIDLCGNHHHDDTRGDHPNPGRVAQHHAHQRAGQEDAVVELDIDNEEDRNGGDTRFPVTGNEIDGSIEPPAARRRGLLLTFRCGPLCHLPCFY